MNKFIATGLCMGFAAIAVMASSAKAVPLPAVNVTPNPITGATIGASATFGFAFIPNSSIDVFALGAFDLEGDGLAQAHDVGIWNSSLTLLASATVPAGVAGTLVNNFRYANIASLTLIPGVEYVVGGFFVTDDPDKIGDGGSSFTSLADIRGIQSRFARNTGGLTFPDRTIGTPMYGAANLLLDITTPEIRIPEPGTLAIFGLGLAGLGLMRRRRKLN